MSSGQEVTATVDKDRTATKKNHTATHLLQWALQEVFGNSVKQQGSLVCPEYLRFDFTWPKALTDQEIKLVEHKVREKIDQAIDVSCAVMDIERARKLGAMALFNEKYGDEVRVVAVGASDENLKEAFSREFCGGTHVDNTSQIESFKIVKEESVSAGVRRITGLTGKALAEYLVQRSEVIDDLTEMLKAPYDQITGRVQKLLDENKKLAKELKSAAKQGGTGVMDEANALYQKARMVGTTRVIVGPLAATVDQARTAIDSLKRRAKSAAIVIGITDDDKVTLIAAMTDDVIKRGLKAGDVVRKIAPIVGGGGGGRPNMAMAGGKDSSKLDEAFEKATSHIKLELHKPLEEEIHIREQT